VVAVAFAVARGADSRHRLKCQRRLAPDKLWTSVHLALEVAASNEHWVSRQGLILCQWHARARCRRLQAFQLCASNRLPAQGAGARV